MRISQRRFIRSALPLLLAVLLHDAAAQAPVSASVRPETAADSAPFMVVRVTGLRAVPWKSYRAMRAAVDAYEKYRFLAPDAVFSFAVMPPPGTSLPPDFKLRVRTRDGQEFPIALENGELFQLPTLPDPGADADLVSNLKGGRLRIGLLVHTRSVPPEKERLGDVRLRCEINGAIAEVDEPGDDVWRPGKRRRNHCGRVTVWHKPRAPAGGAHIVDGTRREALETGGDPRAASPSYRMPISGGGWGNDAIIEFDYRQPPGPLTLSQVAIYEGKN